MHDSAVVTDRGIEDLLRELAPQVLAATVRRFRDFGEAEDAVQDALLAAAQNWPKSGVPNNPRGWLIAVAHRRMIDVIRAEVARREREEAVTRLEPESEAVAADDSLELLFLCCHPELPPASAIALTLRAVGGLTTPEIARAFLVPEATMSQRITRAKKRLAELDRPFGQSSPDRIDQVLRVLYLMFTEGHTTSSGSELRRADLAEEAIRLARQLYRARPDDPEVGGLLALLLLTDSRRSARTGPAGELIPLGSQNRTLWDRALILEGVQLVTRTMQHGLAGVYQVQATIAAVHAQAPDTESTDWEQILALYRLLERISPSPVVSLNAAVAVAMVNGPAAGLLATEGLDAHLASSHRLDAVRGHLREMAGDVTKAIAHYERAARLTTSVPERDYLTIRAARLRQG